MDLNRLGKSIIAMRDKLGQSQEELSAKARVARNAVQGLEKGRANPTIGTLEAIAHALKSRLVVYFGSTEEEKLLDLFGRANDRNKALILGYAQGLIDAHQDEPGLGGKRANKNL